MPKNRSGPALKNQSELKQNSELLKKIKASGLKLTKQRQGFCSIFEKSSQPMSAAEIQKKGRQIFPKLKWDLVTVYRTLHSFVKAGLIQRCDLDREVARYEIILKHGHHHHITCRMCHLTETVDTCGLEEIEAKLKKRGFHGLSHLLSFEGTCRNCFAKS